MNSSPSHRQESNQPDKTDGITEDYSRASSNRALMLELHVDQITGFGDGESRIDGPTVNVDHQKVVSFLEENGFVLSPLFKNNEGLDLNRG